MRLSRSLVGMVCLAIFLPWHPAAAQDNPAGASPPAQESAPNALLDAVARNGFIDNYRGLRIAKSGRRFWIEGGIVWELRSENGERRGQAALFTSWTDV